MSHSITIWNHSVWLQCGFNRASTLVLLNFLTNMLTTTTIAAFHQDSDSVLSQDFQPGSGLPFPSSGTLWDCLVCPVPTNWLFFWDTQCRTKIQASGSKAGTELTESTLFEASFYKGDFSDSGIKQFLKVGSPFSRHCTIVWKTKQ